MTNNSLSTETIEAGKPLAIISYAALPFGVPAFIIPMLTRDNAYALQHAKYAGAIFVAGLAVFAVTFAVAFISCGFGTPLVGITLFFIVPALQGFLAALNGTEEIPMVVGPWAEKMFAGVTLKDDAE
ncbi:MAG: hypothetical protein ACI8RZ_000794 [Myxococcota bacterium]|jgi:hypothetical protein